MRRAIRRTLTALGAPLRWWHALTPDERVLYRAVLLLAIGCWLVTPALGFIVPGVIFALVFFGFSFRRAG